MKKNRIFSVLAGAIFMSPIVADAAYPAYQAQQPQGAVINMPGTVPTIQPNQIVVANSAVAAQPTRVTGALPRVGSNATAAGRQYYQPADFDRLADSGLYIGISAGYSMAIMGGMNADYKSEESGAFVPGAWEEATWDADTVIPLQVSVGASINNDIRVDFSYTRYGGLSNPSTIGIADTNGYGSGGILEVPSSGGAVTANATMLNIYYNIDSYTGYMMGGSLRPYIGAGVGLSLNTIGDYVIYDGHFYPEVSDDDLASGMLKPGTLTGVSDVYAYHNGGTSENFAFMLEAGLTTDMGGGLKLDFFARYANLGTVKTSGSIVLSQTEWLYDNATGEEYPGPYDAVYHYTNWYESGRIGVVDLGVRLRLQF